MTDNEHMVTQKEAADFLNVSTKSISRYRKKGLPYKLILNPVTGKQEVRFRYDDLERWHEGRQLLATYARDGENIGDNARKAGTDEGRLTAQAVDQGFLGELLIAYKDQIESLRDQLEDMREQLGRRDRQIDDLMRLMVGLQLEYKPRPVEPLPTSTSSVPETKEKTDILQGMESRELFETIALPERFQPLGAHLTPAAPAVGPGPGKKVFSREQLSTSILRLRRRGKSYAEIAGGLNQIQAATLSGQPQWTVMEVKTLLPALVDMDGQGLVHGESL